jgi:hypothetical protein
MASTFQVFTNCKASSLDAMTRKVILIISSGPMSKGNVDIRKIPLNSRKITDTNESQITRNF